MSTYRLNCVDLIPAAHRVRSNIPIFAALAAHKLFGFFVGLAMKASKGKANPAQLNEVLLKKLAG
ncbi:MAG: hypothetical protein WCK93_01755 [Nitrosomonadales bacterium]